MAEGKKQRKYDRNRPACGAYKTAQRQEQNKLRKMLRHLKRYCRSYASKGDSTFYKVGSLPKDWADAFSKLNAKLPNYVIGRITKDAGVRLG